MNLIDAYVCSGYYAALALMDGEYDPNAAEVVKRFEDGLETRDVEEDTIFLVWFGFSQYFNHYSYYTYHLYMCINELLLVCHIGILSY